MENKAIIHLLIDFAVKHRRVALNYLDQTGVYQSQHRLLMEIAKNPDISQNQIASLMDISPATVAVSLKKLEKGGFIKREIDENDNRFNKTSITRKGNEVVEQSRSIFEMLDRRIFEGFTPDEKETLMVLLNKLLENLNNMEEEIKSNKEGTTK
jgi:DNA-binding MarR family transcriptional regulator